MYVRRVLKPFVMEFCPLCHHSLSRALIDGKPVLRCRTRRCLFGVDERTNGVMRRITKDLRVQRLDTNGQPTGQTLVLKTDTHVDMVSGVASFERLGRQVLFQAYVDGLWVRVVANPVAYREAVNG